MTIVTVRRVLLVLDLIHPDGSALFTPTRIPAKDSLQRSGIDVSPAHHAADFLPCQLRSVFLRTGNRRRTCSFGKVVSESQGYANALLELQLIEGDDVVKLLTQDRECQIEGDARGQAFCECHHAIGGYARAVAPEIGR